VKRLKDYSKERSQRRLRSANRVSTWTNFSMCLCINRRRTDNRPM